MRRVVTALMLLGLIGVVVAPADAKKRHTHKRAGVKGVVLDASCYGACVEPAPPEPVYAGAVTVTVQRASDGATVASRAVSDGHFRIRLKRGTYDVGSVPPTPPACQPQPGQVCPLSGTQSPAVVQPCLQGETKRVRVRRHRFTHVELHVTNVCIV